jgi:subtilisin family serine protease
VEEDNWISAVEWAESIGVDIISTSLGYLDFTPPYQGYTWQDMDGQTAIITRGATMAVKRGIVVVNAAGNGGPNPFHNTLTAPADGDGVIAVGAVDASGNYASFSSVGPTVDGRIKPDVVARGVDVRVAGASRPNAYVLLDGTSFACPLVAGVAALILAEHPTWSPRQVLDALRQTASRASNPNNLLGWGIVNALDAIRIRPQTSDLRPQTSGTRNPQSAIRNPQSTCHWLLLSATLFPHGHKIDNQRAFRAELVSLFDSDWKWALSLQSLQRTDVEPDVGSTEKPISIAC